MRKDRMKVAKKLKFELVMNDGQKQTFDQMEVSNFAQAGVIKDR
jgi:hypothetical protein